MCYCFYPATLCFGEQGYIAEFTDVPLRSAGETACDATDNAMSDLEIDAERVRQAGSRLPSPSASPQWSKVPRSARQSDTYTLVPLKTLIPLAVLPSWPE